MDVGDGADFIGNGAGELIAEELKLGQVGREKEGGGKRAKEGILREIQSLKLGKIANGIGDAAGQILVVQIDGDDMCSFNVAGESWPGTGDESVPSWR